MTINNDETVFSCRDTENATLALRLQKKSPEITDKKTLESIKVNLIKSCLPRLINNTNACGTKIDNCYMIKHVKHDRTILLELLSAYSNAKKSPKEIKKEIKTEVVDFLERAGFTEQAKKYLG